MADSVSSRRRAIATTVLLALATLGSTFTAAAVAQPATPDLTLDPAQGPRGTVVTAVAAGFDDCPFVGSDDVGLSEVAFSWDGDGTSIEFGTAVISAGTATTSFVVPAETGPGTHAVFARCTGDAAIAAERDFEVTPSTSDMTVVPDLVGLTVEQAVPILEEARLVLGEASGDGDRVRSQDPPPGDEAITGSPVDVVLGVAFAEVPDLTGLTLAEARDALASAQLTVGEVSGTGDQVGDQSPASRSQVPVGTPVDLTMQQVPPPTVVVPNLVGMSKQDAIAALDPLGLRLVLSGSSEGDLIEGQDPAPGTTVPRGSDVTVITTAAPSVSIAFLIATAVALLLAIAALATMLLRGRHRAAQRRWVAEHVRARPVTPVRVGSEIVETPGEHDAIRHVVRIEPHPGEHRHEFEEVRR
ncbi:PASTA domain-containing protein [Agromyces aurantiacus]|uniref:PASTA domain-containing protein n=1 Tax=Agromyces aurantiacus TaxID=165814 RepID=A0ABV9R3V8_9MICO|nr:PASTA domain-containing protein [Agromyces aurantiacus]MBM7503498.1 hypothetical protein [Agromyces aurantiacus]